MVMSVAQQHPTEMVEVAPAALQPLNTALTHEQHLAILDEEQRKVGPVKPVSQRQKEKRWRRQRPTREQRLCHPPTPSSHSHPS